MVQLRQTAGTFENPVRHCHLPPPILRKPLDSAKAAAVWGTATVGIPLMDPDERQTSWQAHMRRHSQAMSFTCGTGSGAEAQAGDDMNSSCLMQDRKILA